MTSNTSCGACKFLRRKCRSECVFAPYFSYDEAAVHFSAVHKVFGASNVSRLLLRLPHQYRGEAAISVSYQALARIRDPVYGCVAYIFALQQQVANLQEEIRKHMSMGNPNIATTHNYLLNNDNSNSSSMTLPEHWITDCYQHEQVAPNNNNNNIHINVNVNTTTCNMSSSSHTLSNPTMPQETSLVEALLDQDIFDALHWLVN